MRPAIFWGILSAALLVFAWGGVLMLNRAPPVIGGMCMLTAVALVMAYLTGGGSQ
jgi:hypothetical protein